jgi:hypothetical protein
MRHAQYYERENPGLGFAFIAPVERCTCTQAILQFPEAGTPLNDMVCRRLVASFPYGVLYRITPHQVRILALMNLKRRPFYWVGRV